MKHPVLLIVRGLPGSGKTYLAERLQKVLEAEFGTNQVVMLDPDATDYKSDAYQKHVAQQTAEGVDPILHPYRFLRAQAYEAITTNKLIVWNQPFTNLDSFRKVTARLEEYATEHHTTLPMLVVEVELDPSIAKQRVEKRKKNGGHGPSEATFQRFINDYASFGAYGYNTLAVSGDADPTASIENIIQALSKLT